MRDILGQELSVGDKVWVAQGVGSTPLIRDGLVERLSAEEHPQVFVPFDWNDPLVGPTGYCPLDVMRVPSWIMPEDQELAIGDRVAYSVQCRSAERYDERIAIRYFQMRLGTVLEVSPFKFRMRRIKIKADHRGTIASKMAKKVIRLPPGH